MVRSVCLLLCISVKSVCCCGHSCLHVCPADLLSAGVRQKQTPSLPSHFALSVSLIASLSPSLSHTLYLSLSLYGTKLPLECPDPSHESEAAVSMSACVSLRVCLQANAKKLTDNKFHRDRQAGKETKRTTLPHIGHQ